MVIPHPKHEHLGTTHLPKCTNGSSGMHECHPTRGTFPGTTEYVADFEHPLFTQKTTNGPGNMPASDDIESLHTFHPYLFEKMAQNRLLH